MQMLRWVPVRQQSDSDDASQAVSCRYLCCGGDKKGKQVETLNEEVLERRFPSEMAGHSPDVEQAPNTRCSYAVRGALALLVLSALGVLAWAAYTWLPWPKGLQGLCGGGGDFASRSMCAAAAVEQGECNFFEYPNGSADCFCQLAGHASCVDRPCSCEQGCESKIWQASEAVTFQNLRQAGLCQETRALLTIPQAYFEHVGMLARWCPNGTQRLLRKLLENGFQTYQEQVARQPVKQCVHAPEIVSQPWLHVHTICLEGVIDGLQETSEQGWCGVAQDLSDMQGLAESLSRWALHGALAQNVERFDSCCSMGCQLEIPRPLCGCSRDCQEGVTVTCCPDFVEMCLAGGGPLGKQRLA